MSNQLKGLTDRNGSANSSQDTVERHKGGYAINGKGSYTEAEVRDHLIKNSKNF